MGSDPTSTGLHAQRRRGFLISTAAMLIVLLLLLPAAQSQSANHSGKPDFATVSALIQQKIASDHIPSISAAVARNDEILWEKGFGWANREQHIAATEHTMYALASVTKLMTATAIMVLRDRKQLDLDRPINEYLGPAKLRSSIWNPSDATVRRVATHTAGLATYDNGYYCRGNEGDCQDIMLSRFGVLIWKPGERFDYSNLGYGALGDVIRHVSGMKYGDFLTSQILAPLGMTYCSLGITPGLEAYAAQRYSSSDGSPADWSPNEPSSQEAASSLFCSAHDLVRFGMFHLKEHVAEKSPVLSASAIDEMQASTVPADDGYRYGFGWWHEDRFGYKVMYASGGYDYAQALLFTVPAEKIAIAVLVNTGHATVAKEVADEIASLLIPAYRENRVKAAHHDRQQPAKEANALASLSGTWNGTVQTETREVPLTLTVDKSGTVHAFLASEPASVEEGAEYRDGQFRAKISGTSGSYERDSKKALALDLQLFRRSSGVLNGGASTVPLSQPEWGLVTYSVQLTAAKKQ